MRVAVVSTYPNTGNTTVAAMLGTALACTQEVDVALTYTTLKARRLCEYMGVTPTQDITTNLSQINQLIQADAISPEECKDYLLRVQNHLYILDTSSDTLSEEDRIDMMKKVYSFNVAPITICDISSNKDVMTEPLTQDIIAESDMILLNANPDLKTKKRLDEWREEGLLPMDKPVLLFINMFDERIYSIRDLARINGFKVRNSVKLHRNPFIQKYSNDGKLTSIVTEALKRNLAVLELNQDLKEICEAIMYYAQMRFKWEDK